MKINNCCLKPNKTLSYTGGLNKQMVSEIKRTNISSIENRLNTQGINADFAGNKFIAWSSLKVTELVNNLNKKFHLNIELPRNIFVKNLTELHTDDTAVSYGITNFLPCRLYKNNNDIMPAMTVIFNKEFPWHMVDEISDYEYHTKNTTSNFFLESFIHEFSHIAHEGNLLNKFGVDDTVKKLVALNNPNNNNRYKLIYGSLAKENICNYAQECLFDLTACDMSKRIIDKLDKNTITPFDNPFKNSPYEKIKFNLFPQIGTLSKLLKKNYNGDLSMLYKTTERNIS